MKITKQHDIKKQEMSKNTTVLTKYCAKRKEGEKKMKKETE